MSVDVVIPTVGRPSLGDLLEALAAGAGPPPGRVILVDDRRGGGPLPGLVRAGSLADRVRVLPGRGAGPAAARNLGWRASRAEWIAFLDDDVVPGAGWPRRLAEDLSGLADDVAASQGRLRVPPPPAGRRPTDHERGTAGLETARWATADMAYRRAALMALGGFDERFPRAYREDADLGLRAARAGRRIVAGRRMVTHPVRPAGPWASVRAQAGNGDDVLMRALHGRGWRATAGAPPGRRPRHLATVAAGGLAAGALAAGRPRPAALFALGWLAGTAELAWARIAPGPRDRAEVATMLVTSVALPFAAAWHTARGALRVRRLARRGHLAVAASANWPRARARPAAVLLDRDGTLVHDVPYNGDPARVRPVAGAVEALGRLRAAGVPTALVSNQSGVARGLVSAAQVRAVNARLEELVGPLGPWLVCPHGPGEGCACRKPAPGLVLAAAAALGVDPAEACVVGDIGADVAAARAAGARAVLVPTRATRPEEVHAALELAADLETAIAGLLAEPPA